MLPSTVPVSSYITNVLTYTYSDTNKRAFNPVARGVHVQLVMRAAFNGSSPDGKRSVHPPGDESSVCPPGDESSIQ